MIAVGRFDSTFEMTVPDDAVDTQNASEPLDSDANASLTHERVHLTVPRGVFHLVSDVQNPSFFAVAYKFSAGTSLEEGPWH